MKIKCPRVIRSRACGYWGGGEIYYGVGSAQVLGPPQKHRSVSYAAHAALTAERNPIGFRL